MRFPHNKKCCHQNMVCKVVAWLTPYVRTFLLLCACVASVAAEAAPQSFGKWQVSPVSSAGEESLTLSLKAEKAVEGWMKTFVPVLTIQCTKGNSALYVETGMGLEVTMVDKQVVRLQFDNDKPFPHSWREITNATVSARDATVLIKKLVQAQKFIFEFTPFNAAPAQAEFAVVGLSAYLPQLAKVCWGK